MARRNPFLVSVLLHGGLLVLLWGAAAVTVPRSPRATLHAVVADSSPLPEPEPAADPPGPPALEEPVPATLQDDPPATDTDPATDVFPELAAFPPAPLALCVPSTPRLAARRMILPRKTSSSASPRPIEEATIAAPRPAGPSRSASPVEGNPAPRYPVRAAEAGAEGVVLLLVTVGPRGTVDGIRVLRSSGHPLLDRAARSAVARWTFLPALEDGEPVAATLEVPVRFRLR